MASVRLGRGVTITSTFPRLDHRGDQDDRDAAQALHPMMMFFPKQLVTRQETGFLALRALTIAVDRLHLAQPLVPQLRPKVHPDMLVYKYTLEVQTKRTVLVFVAMS